MMADHPGRRALRARRLLLGGLTLGATAGATWLLGAIMAAEGILPLEYLLLGLFALLFGWVALSFWTALFGFFHLLGRRLPAEPAAAMPPAIDDYGPRTAIVMPIYNESPARVCAGLRAVHDQIAARGRLDGFHFYLLSDTTDPDVWLAEELAWLELVRAAGGQGRIFYRHRPENVGRKSGNIADFCINWGRRYDYMLVLDADSLMAGGTIVEMVRRMDAEPRLGILQVPALPVNRESLFARLQQFAASAYGAIFSAGATWWQGGDGNYYGHNATIRVAAFLRCCGLPTLPGAEPLGGEILSHDFVEAALIRRGGYAVRTAADLGGSFEEPPPTLIDYAKRDRRWCQGNLQHLRILFARGLGGMSRLHLAMGAMAYLASPLWLVFLLLSGIEAVHKAHARPHYFTADSPFPSWPVSYAKEISALALVTALLLLLPKLLAVFLICRDKAARQAHGGGARLAGSVVLETLFSVLLAPILMLFQTSFVAFTLAGRAVRWTAQRRGDDRTGLREAVGAHARQTLFGLALGLATYLLARSFFWWLTPVLLGLVLSVPLSMLSSSIALGQRARRWGLFLTPAETAPAPVLRRLRDLLEPPGRLAPTGASPFMRAIADPLFNALHVSLLRPAARAAGERYHLRGLVEKVLRRGEAALTGGEKKELLSDGDSMLTLHRLAWARSDPAAPRDAA